MPNKKKTKTRFENAHTFIVYTDVVKDVDIPITDEEGKIIGYEQDIEYIKKNVKVKRTFFKQDIDGWSQHMNDRGKVLKTFSRIHHSKLGDIVVKERFENIEGIINPKIEDFEVKGFKRYD